MNKEMGWIMNVNEQYPAQESFIRCENLVKIYKVADLEVVALQGLDLEVNQGEIMSLVGASGSGKSTLLNVVGGLDTPSAGKVTVAGHDLLNMNDRDRVHYKRHMVGFVWQQPGRNLLPYLTAIENVTLPMMLTKMRAAERKERALALLDVLGLVNRSDFKPDRLSGGEQQRVALAVALANNPPLLLADELTGQLDSAAAAQLFNALRDLNQAYNTTIIVVTHDPQVAAKVDRVVGIRDGRTSTEMRRERNLKDGSMEEEEWVILDRAGRLQLPQVYVDTLAMQGRVKARLEPDHVSIWPTIGLEAVSAETADMVKVWRPERRYDIAGDRETAVSAPRPAVGVVRLWRTYHTEAEEIHAVQDLTLSIPGGHLSVIKGRSGSGKTTLLNLIGGLDEPTQGTIIIDGENLGQLSAAEKTELRRHKIGFVFQNFGLLPFLSARENIEAPLRLLHTARPDRKQRTDEVLSLVGLTDRANHRTHELSGGEQQRVALARALVGKPALILADEPTGQLDTVTGSNIIALLKEISHQTSITIIVASHDPKVEEAADYVYELHDGQWVTDLSAETTT
jgi:peptide/nickel transport system ATP-binding protein